MPRPSVASRLSIAQLESLIASRRHQIARYERRRNGIAKQLAKLDAKIAALGGNGHAVHHTAHVGRPARAGRHGNARSLPQTIVHILGNHGKPMKVSDLVQTCLDSGYKTTSPNFRSIVNQALIKGKNKLYVPARRGYYQIKK